MSELAGLGYHAFAYGYLLDDVQFASTPGAQCCSSPKIIQYLYSVITAGKCIILDIKTNQQS